MKRSSKYPPLVESPSPELSWLCLCCIVGVVLGRWANSIVTEPVHEALRGYIQQYAVTTAQSFSSLPVVFSTAITYLRCPVVLFLLGCTVVGVAFIPVVCMVESFFLSFAVSGFASAFGRTGVVLALSTFGFRCLIALPCMFMMALWGMDHSRQIRKSRNRQKRLRIEPLYGIRLTVCTLVSLLGMAIDLSITPRLLEAALEKLT